MYTFYKLFLSFALALVCQISYGQIAVATEDSPVENLVGEDFCYAIKFSNDSPDVGYQPYLRIVIPPEFEFDNISFGPSSGQIIVNEVFDMMGLIEDPLAEEDILGTEGNRLIIYQMPIGSVVQNGPDLLTEVCLTIADDAPLNIPVSMDITPVFQFGNSPTGGSPVVGNTIQATVTPILYTYEKKVETFEGERPPGPTWAMTYSLVVDIANGKTLTNLQFQDILPPELQFVGNQSISGASGTFTQLPSLTSPGGTLAASVSSAVGTTSGEDVVVEFDAYIVDILNHGNCGTQTVTNNSSFGLGNLNTQDDEQVLARHVTVEKSTINGDNQVPGGTVDFNINFEVSDYDVVDFLSLTDLVPDGLETPVANTIILTVGGVNIPITPTVTYDSNTGVSTIFVDVRAAYGQDLVGPISGTLTYPTSIKQEFESLDAQILANDSFGESVTMEYSTVQNNSPCITESSSGVSIVGVGITKEILNQQPEYDPGDVVTYRLTMNLFSGDSKDVTFTDYFPLPVLNITNFVPDFGNNIRYVSGGGYVTGTAPTITKDIATNSLSFYWPVIFTGNNNVRLALDIDVPITVEPFGDGLFHSNIFQAETSNTPSAVASSTTSVLIQIFAPEMTIDKKVISADHGNVSNGNLNNADAGDNVTFLITGENIGNADAFDVTIKDNPPPQFTGCNLVSVTRGNGSTNIPHTGDLFTTGIVLSNPVKEADEGGSTQENQVLVTYTCTLTDGVIPEENIINTGELEYSSANNVTNFPPISDDAETTIREPEISKSLIGINPNYTGASSTVQIGDTLTYSVTIEVPEGTSPNSFFRDNLDSGLEFVDFISIVPSADISTNLPGGFAAVAATNISGLSSLNLSCGDVVNANTANNVEDEIIFTYRVLVNNIASNTDGRRLRNRASWRTNNKNYFSNRPQVRVRDSDLSIIKGVSGTTNGNAVLSDPGSTPPDSDLTDGEGNDAIDFTITLTNDGDGAALDVVIIDPVPDGLENCVINSVVDQNGDPVAYTGDLFNGGISLTNPMPPNSQVIVNHTCTVEADVSAGQIIDTEATATYDPDPGSTTPNSISDPASVEIIRPEVSKSSVSVLPGYGTTPDEAAIGEVLTYQAEITIPQGMMTSVVFEDILSEGLAFIGVDSVFASTNVATNQPGGFPALKNAALISAQGSGAENQDRKLNINFGDITNSDTDGTIIETITVIYQAVVLNINANVRGTNLENTAAWTWDYTNNPGSTFTSEGSTSVRVIEPELTISKDFLDNNILNTEETFLTLTISHTTLSNADANDVVVEDILPFGMQYIANTLSSTCPSVQLEFTEDLSPATGGTVRALIPSFPIAENCTVSLRVQYDPASDECQDLENCATLTYESLNADDQATLPSSPTNTLGNERTGDAANPGQLHSYNTQACDTLFITNGLADDPFITGPTAGCEGDEVIISGVNSYSGSIVTYEWTGPNGLIQTTNFELVIDPVTPADAGDYTVRVTVDGCPSDLSNTFTLDVYPKPAQPTASTGGPYCVGDNIFLFGSSAPTNGSWLWTGPNGYTSTAQNPIIPNAETFNSGQYSLQVADENGCLSPASDPVNVIVNPAPAAPQISNDSPVCGEGMNDVILTATGVAAGGIVNWYNAQGMFVGMGNPLTLNNVMMVAAGDYYAEVEANGCTSAPSNTTTVVIDDLPNETAFAGDDATYCTGTSTVMLSATAPSIGTGAWSQTGGLSVNIINPNNPSTQVTGITTGTYTFRWTLTNGACADYSFDEVSISIEGQASTPTASNNGPGCEGGNIQLTAMGGNPGDSYEWIGPNGYTSNVQNPILTNLTSVNAGNYQVRVITASGCISDYSAPTTVLVEGSVSTPLLYSDSPVCEGENITLTTTATGNSFAWFGPDGGNPSLTTSTASADILPTDSYYGNGQWRVQVSSTTGCVSQLSDPITVEVRQAPAAPTVTANTALCEGNDIQLTAGGSSAAFYSWTGPNGFTSNAQNPVIFAASTADSGTYEVTATENSCTSAAASITLTINASPTSMPSNNGGACGADLELFANTTGGQAPLTYSWSGPNNFTSFDENPVIQNPSASNEGTYTLIVTDANSCVSDPMTTQVSLISAGTFQPFINSNAPVCEGEELTLTAPQFTGNSVTYEWTGPNGTSTSNSDYPNAASITIASTTAANAGNYTVSVTVDGCTSGTSPTENIVISPVPNVAPTADPANLTCVDGFTDIQLNANATGGTVPYTYEWSGPNGFSSTVFNPIINNATVDDAGEYQVRVVNASGCSSSIGSVFLNLESQPLDPVVSGTTSVCTGERLEVSVQNYQGGTVSYTWLFGSTNLNNNSNILIIDPISAAEAGTYSVSVEIDGCTSEVITFNVSVSDGINISLADQSFTCVNENTNLTLAASVTGGTPPYTYAWTGPNGYTSSQANPTIINAGSDDSGIYTLTVSDAANTCTAQPVSAAVTITEQAETPQIQGDTNLCFGEQILLSTQAYQGANVSYTWTFNGQNLGVNSMQLLIDDVDASNAGTYEVVVDVNGCVSAASSVSVSVNDEINVSVDNQVFKCVNNATTIPLLSTVSGGTQPYTYAWTGPNGFSSSQANPTIFNVELDDGGTYNLVVTDAAGCVSEIASGVIVITEGIDEPQITSSGTVCNGGSVTLTATTYSGSTVAYAWFLDGNVLAENTSVLEINNISAANAGNYQVAATVDGCSTISDLFNLEIFPQPEVSIAQADPLLCTDGSNNITLDATVSSGLAPFSYAWNGPNGFMSSAEDAVIFNASASESGNYSLVVTDANGCQSETAFTEVQITDAIATPIITGDAQVCEGEELTLQVDVYDGLSSTYIWYLNNTPINNNSNVLNYPSATIAEAGDYTVIVYQGNCADTSDVFTVLVNENPTLTINQPPNLDCTDGTQEVILDAVPMSANPPFTFSWTGPNAYSSTDEDAIINNVSEEDAGTYTLVMSDANGCSSPAVSVNLNVSDGIDQPVITSSGPTCEGGSIALEVQPVTGANISYGWMKDGVNLNNNSAQLFLSPVTQSDAGDYTVSVTADGCSATSAVYTAEIFTRPTVSITNPGTFECVDGTQDIVLQSNVSGGAAPYTYAWTATNGYASTVASPVLNNAGEEFAGTYTLIVTDANGCTADAQSLDLIITNTIPKPEVSVSGSLCEGDDLTLEILGTYTGISVNYTWKKDGVAVATTGSTLSLNNIMPGDSGMYSVEVTVDGCSSESDAVTVNINVLPEATIDTVAPITCTDGTQDLTLTASIAGGTTPFVYNWTGPNGFASTSAAPTLLNIDSDFSGTYQLVITDANDCVSLTAETEIEITDSPDVPIITSSGAVCEGEIITLTAAAYSGANVTYDWQKDGVSLGVNSNVLTLSPVTSADAGDYVLTVNVDACTVTSSPFTQAVFASPEVTVTQPSVFACTDGTQSVTFDAAASGGSGSYTYSWSGPNGFSSTLEDPTISSLSSADAGTYSVIVTDGNNCVSEVFSVELQVNDGLDTPQITSSGPTCEGGVITLSVQQYAGANVTYDWRKDGVSLNNNSNELQLNPVSASDAGNYEVFVSVDACNATSTVFGLTVFATPTVSIDNVAPFTCTDGTEDVTFNATAANGASPYTYAWSGPNGFSSTLEDPTISDLSSADAGTYTLIVTDSNGCASTAASIELEVNDGLDIPQISSSGPTCEGGVITLFVQQYAGANVIYDWRKDGVSLNNNSNELQFNPVSTSDAGDYEVFVSVDGCDATSTVFSLTVFATPTASIAGVAPFTCTDGTEDVTFNATAAGGAGSYTYAWSGPNGFSSTLEDPTISDLSLADAGTYTLVVTDSNGCASQAASIELEVSDGLDSPQITSSGPTCEGGVITLSVQQYAGANVTYDWRKDGFSLNNNSNELQLNPVSTSDAGDYELFVSVDGCDATSSVFNLEVFAAPTVSIDNVMPFTCTDGTEDVTFNATPAGGAGSYTYAWSGPNGFSSTLEDPTISDLSSADAGTYTLVVTDSNGCSSPATSIELEVNEGIEVPQITSSGPTCEGGEITLSVQQYSGANVIYQWYKDGLNLSNNNNVLTLNPVSTSNAGNYSVFVIADNCSSVSADFPVTVFEQPTVSINPVPTVSCTDGTQDITLSAVITGGDGAYNYAWTGPNNFTSDAANPILSSITSAQAGSYALTITDGKGCSSETATVQVQITDTPDQPQIISSGPTCEGNTVSLSIQAFTGSNITYAWTLNGATIINNSNQLIIDPVTLNDAGTYAVEVEIDGCTVNSVDYELEVYENPTAALNQTEIIKCADGTQNFTIDATPTGGSGTYTFAWTGPNSYTSTMEDAVLVNISSASAGVYSLIVTDSNGCESEQLSTVVDISDAPVEPIISSNSPLCEGENLNLSIDAYSGGTVDYEWFKDGVSIGNNNNVLTVNPALPSDSGDYSVRVTVDACFADSDIFNVLVNANPQVTIDPTPPFACTDGTEDLELSASIIGNGSYTYAWSGPNNFSSSSPSPMINNISEVNTGTYSLLVTDSNGCIANTASTVVEIIDGIDVPQITGSGPACSGEAVTLSVQAYGGSNVTYNWTKDGQALNINNAQIVLDPVTAADAGNYQVEVTVNDCSEISAPFTVTVYDRPNASVSAIAPIDCTDGTEDVTFDLTVTGTTNYTVSWTGPNGFVSTLEDPTLSNITSANSGTYIAVVTNENDCTSDPVSLELAITDAVTQPIITSTGPACEGEEITLSVAAAGGSNVTYEWTLNGNPLGISANTVIIPAATAADAGDYALTVTADNCTASSAVYTQVVNPLPTVSIALVAPIECTDGTQDLTLDATVTGGTNLTYSWTGPNGFVSSLEDPTLSNITSAQSGTYQLTVLNEAGCESSPVSVEVSVTDAQPTPLISSAGPVCEGESVVLEISEYTGANVFYQWTLNGSLLANNSNQIILNPATPAVAGNYEVTVNVDGCTASSAVYEQVVFAQPTVSIDPIADIECTDGTQDLNLDATAVGTAPFVYSWAGVNGFSSTSEDPVLSGISSDDSGTYTVQVEDANGCLSNPVSIEISITDQPDQPQITSSGPTCEGGVVSLSVAEYTGTNVSYTWLRDGNDIFNNSNELQLSPASLQDAGEYVVIVSEGNCTATSAALNIEIYESPVASIAAISPIDCTDGTEDIVLDASVSGGDGNYTYAWSGPNGFNSTLEDPTLSNVSNQDNGTYTLTVSDGNGCTAAAVSVEVNVTLRPEIPQISSTGPVCAGAQVILETQVYTGSTVTYEWELNGNILPITGNELNLNPASTADAGTYQVTVTVDGCIAVSQPFELIINERPDAVINPLPEVLCTNGSLNVSLEANVSGGLTPYEYAWTGPNGWFSGEISPELTGVSSEDAGVYSLVITDANGCTSPIASTNFTVTDAVAQPTIASNAPVCAGETVTMEIPAYAGSSVDYVWEKDGQALNNNSNVLFLSPAEVSDIGSYTVTVTADGCSGTSPVYNLTIFSTPEVVVSDVAPILCTDGNQELTLDAEVTAGTEPISYTWSGPNGFTSSSEDPTLVNIDASFSGTYTVQVSDANACSGNAYSVEVDIQDGLAQPQISANGPVCAGEQVVLSVTEYAGSTVTYEWRKDGQVMAGENANTLVIDPAGSENNGSYTVAVSADGCNAISPEYSLEIFDLPQITIDDVPPVICTAGDEDLVLNANITGGVAPFTYEWIGPNDFFSVNEDPVLVNVDASFSGSYTVYVTDGNGCEATAVTIEVDVKDALEEPVITSNAPVCEGEQVILEVQEYSGIDLTYEWFKNGQSLGVITNNEWLINPGDLSDEGNYTVHVTVDGCENTSDIYQLDIHPQPVVIIAPVTPLPCTDGNQEFALNASATGAGDLLYEWTGPNGFTGNNEDPVLINVTEADNGTYSVIVTDANGCTSLPTSIEIDVTEAIPEPVVLSSGPACIGESVLLSVPQYTGVNVNYAWTLNGQSIANNSNELLLDPVEADDEGDYAVTITSDECSTTAEPITVTLYESPDFAPAADTEPICHGGDLSLEANVVFENNLTFAWAGPNGFVSALPNPVINEVSILNNGEYLLTVTNSNNCSVTQSVQVNNILPGPAVPTIASNAPICEGEDLILETSGSGVLFEWIGPLGDSESTLQNQGLTTTAGTTVLPASSIAYLAGDWSVRLTDANGCVADISAPIDVAINQVPIATATNDGEICEGADAQLYANALPGATYEWRIAGTSEVISTEQNPLILNQTANTTYELSIRVNDCTSDPVTTTVTVSEAPEADPYVAYDLNSDCSPEDLRLFVNEAIFQDVESYSWVGPNGFASNAPNPVIPNATAVNNGVYEVTLTDFNGCSATYFTENINIIPDVVPEPIISHSGPACQGETITLSVPQYFGSDVTYNWNLNGINITGQNTNELVISPVGNINEGIYSVSITVDGCTLESDEYTLDVFEQPTLAPAFFTENNCEGNTLQLFANAGNFSGEITYSWTGPNGFTSNAPNPLIPNTSLEDNGAYTVEVSSESACLVNESIIVDVITAQPSVPQIITEGEVCEGEEFTLAAQQQSYPDNAVFTWFNGAGDFIGNGATLTLLANATVAISPYTLQVEANDCVSNISAPAAVVVNELPVATATNNGPICGNEQAQLFAGSITGATYEWRIQGQSEIISVEQNPILFNLEASTIFELTVISSGCTSQTTALTSVEVNEAPELINTGAIDTDGNTGTFCAGTNIVLTAQNNNPSAGNLTYTWTGPNGFTYTANAGPGQALNVSLPNINTGMEGTYQVSVVSENGCSATPQSVLLDLDAIPQTPELSLANDFLCEGQMIELNATLYTGTSVNYEWHFVNADGEDFVLDNSESPTLLLPSASVSNMGEYYVIVTVNGCASSVSDTEFLTIYGTATPPVVTNSTDADNPVCEGETVQLNIPFFENATYEWFGPNGFTSAAFAPVISPATAADAGDYFALVSFGGCSSVLSTTSTVYVNEIPDAPTITASEAICEGGEMTLTVTSPLNTTEEDNLVFEWYYAATNALVATTAEPVLTFENTLASQTGEYYVIYSLNGCTAEASENTFVDITAIPEQTADAGVTETLCAALDYTLQAVPALTGTGVWTSLTGASIVNPSDPNTDVFNLQQGDNSFVWTLSVGACEDYSADTVNINISIIPEDSADAGLDQEICGSTDTDLSASTPVSATGIWTQPDAQAGAGIVIVNPTDPNTSITGMEDNETYIFIWTLSEGTCADFDVDTVQIFLSGELSSQAFISGEEEIFACGEDELTITAETPAEGTGAWTTSGGALIVEPNNPSSIIADLDPGANVFYWTLSNGACEDYSTDSITIWNDLPLLANDDFFNVQFNDSLRAGDVLLNDLTSDVLDWEFTLIRRAGHGELIDLGGGVFDYIPNQNYFGDDFFEYQLCNLNCPELCDTATVFINILGQTEEGDCFTPNLITPNGDGMNDALMFPCLDEYQNNSIMIFNRWGDKVYDAAPYQNDWIGTYKGQDLPAGTYFFILQLEPTSVPIQKYFTLVR